MRRRGVVLSSRGTSHSSATRTGVCSPNSISFLLQTCRAHTSPLTNRGPRGGNWGGTEHNRVLGEGSAEEHNHNPLCPISWQQAAPSRAWCLGGGSCRSAPCSPPTRAATPAWHRVRAPRRARTSWCWCEVRFDGLVRGPGLSPPWGAFLLLFFLVLLSLSLLFLAQWHPASLAQGSPASTACWRAAR